MGSAATPGVPCALPSAFTPPGHFAAHLGSFLFIQSQLLLPSAASDSNLMAYCKACPLTPNPSVAWLLPWLQNLCAQPLRGANGFANPVVLLRLLGLNTSVFSVHLLPHGTVSSMMSKDFCEVYSSVRLETGSSRTLLPYRLILLRHRGSPSHFLI